MTRSFDSIASGLAASAIGVRFLVAQKAFHPTVSVCIRYSLQCLMLQYAALLVIGLRARLYEAAGNL